jgi:putative chitinase
LSSVILKNLSLLQIILVHYKITVHEIHLKAIMQITETQFNACFPNLKDGKEWLKLLNSTLQKYGISSVNQVAMFLAQTGHESGDFKFLKENLNYSKEGLLKTFPSRFNEATATECARNPEKIATTVYSNRMGNGDKSTGDAFDYIGRGILQVTGKNNYAACSEFIHGDDTYLMNPDLLCASKEDSILSAIWFWKLNKLDTLTDIVQITKIINGGLNGLDDRSIRYSKYQTILSQGSIK